MSAVCCLLQLLVREPYFDRSKRDHPTRSPSHHRQTPLRHRTMASIATDLPYAAEAETSLSYDELEVSLGGE